MSFGAKQYRESHKTPKCLNITDVSNARNLWHTKNEPNAIQIKNKHFDSICVLYSKLFMKTVQTVQSKYQ